MHQNLKFNLSLTKKQKWQPIMATEYIGTFYMIYIKINDLIIDSNENIIGLKSQFYLQNYRGAIKMGLNIGNSKNSGNNETKIYSIPRDFEKDGVHYEVPLSVTPFHNCDESAEIAIIFDNGIEINKTIFEVEVVYSELPQEIFNPSELDKSRYIHPLYCFREGDNMQHIYYKKNIGDVSEVYGGYYDERKMEDSDTSAKIRIHENSTPSFSGSKFSPTCDAKRTDIIG